eukprot:TRINITY_DN5263_c0_g1_i2.p1 TRINITY_DN5263_c0_g1~~TRINITY_DN5263_c0_g1_i2.p1  ORF type:complete len:774 (+),score=108.71 TRINITY_DN5263_c0_g1_i2:14-2335(+)
MELSDQDSFLKVLDAKTSLLTITDLEEYSLEHISYLNRQLSIIVKQLSQLKKNYESKNEKLPQEVARRYYQLKRRKNDYEQYLYEKGFILPEYRKGSLDEMLKELKDRRRRLKKKYEVLVSRRRSSSASGTATPVTNTSFTNSTPVIIPGHSQPTSPRTSDDFSSVNNTNNNNLTSSELTTSHNEGTPMCDHGVSAHIYRVTKPGPNQGRVFYACGARDREGRPARCGFFKWADDGVVPVTPPKPTTPPLVAPLVLSTVTSPSTPIATPPSQVTSPSVPNTASPGAPLTSSSFSAGVEYLEQSILFQKAHRLLVQHEELIRLTRSVRDKYYVANQPNTKHLDPVKLKQLRDEVYQVMESCLEDAKKLVMLMKKSATHVLERSSPIEGPCALCLSDTPIICSECIKRVKGNRDMVSLKKYGNELLKAKVDSLKTDIEGSGLQKRIAFLKKVVEEQKADQHAEKLRQRIDILRKDIERDRQLLLAKQEQNRAKKEELERAQKELQSRREEYKQHYSTQLTRLEELNSEFTTELVNCRRVVISDLLSIMPLNPRPSNEDEMEFIAFFLPRNGDYSTKREDFLSAAFGNIVLFVSLLAKYLRVNLPFRMAFKGSSSLIWKPNDDHRFVLNFTDKTIKIALRLLNENILHLCFTQGILFRAQRPDMYTLLNLFSLIRHKNLGCELPAMDIINHEANNNTNIRRLSTSPSPFISSTLSASVLDVPEADEFTLLDFTPPLPDRPDEIQHFERALEDQRNQDNTTQLLGNLNDVIIEDYAD